MTVQPGGSRAEPIEAAIRQLRGVQQAAVVLDDHDRIVEIHVASSPEREVRLLVRDIQTLVLTQFHISVDRRVISVVPMGRAKAAPEVAPQPASHGNGAAAPGPEKTVVGAVGGLPAPQRSTDRIRFVSVNLYVSGPRAQAQVELRWKGITRTGNATGTATREGSHQLIAEATVAALEEYLEDDWSLAVGGVQFVRLGREEAAVVGLTLLAHRQEKTLAGCCTVEQDAAQAVALATLSALNRVVGGLETREPIEYVLRPTSFQEASEAKKT